MNKNLTLKGMLMGAVVATTVAMPAMAEVTESTPGAIKAVDLVGTWVKAGAPNGAFTYKDVGGHEVKANFDTDVLPLFTAEGIWGEDSAGTPLAACSSCHTGNTEESLHEMDLTSYKGIMIGGDALAKPPGVAILGQSKMGATDYNWGHSKLKQRLRDNRMPPGIEFDITESNRDGPCLDAHGKKTGEYSDCKINAVETFGKWADGGAKNDATFKNVILPMMTQEGYWGNDAEGSALPACSSCHTGITEESLHEMDMTSYTGLMTGGDSLAKPPGVSLIANYNTRHAKKGESVADMPSDWGHSTLKHRLRDNRMPPGIEFDITEENRDGPLVAHGKR